MVEDQKIKFNEIRAFSFIDKLSFRAKKIIFSHYAKEMIKSKNIDLKLHEGISLEIIKEIEQLDKSFFLKEMRTKIKYKPRYSNYNELISPENEITRFQQILINIKLNDEKKEILKNLYENYSELFHEPVIRRYGVIEEKISLYNMVAKTSYNVELIDNASVFINYLSKEERLNICGCAINHYLNKTLEKLPEFVFRIEKDSFTKFLKNAEEVYPHNENLKMLKAEYLNMTLSVKSIKKLIKI